MTIDVGLPVSTGQVFVYPQRRKAESAQPEGIFWLEIGDPRECSTTYPQAAGVVLNP
jgi:hypothetical protein